MSICIGFFWGGGGGGLGGGGGGFRRKCARNEGFHLPNKEKKSDECLRFFFNNSLILLES